MKAQHFDMVKRWNQHNCWGIDSNKYIILNRMLCYVRVKFQLARNWQVFPRTNSFIVNVFKAVFF